MPYPTIRLCTFKAKSDLPKGKVYVVNFPEEAKEFIKRITAKRDNTVINKISLPVKSLYKALRLIPGLIHLGKISPKEGEFWLYSSHQLPTEFLSTILSEWIDTEFPDEPAKKGKVGITFEERQSAMSYLSPEKLVFNPLEVCYTNHQETHPNGTVNLSGNDFILLPHILATKLSKPELNFEVDGKQLQFYRSLPSNGQGAELISWPPLPFTTKGQTFYYSIVLTLKIMQEPGLHYPRFDITPSIRRWLSLNDSKLSNNHASYAYIRAKLPWGQALNPDNFTEYFISCQMVLKNGIAEWDQNLGILLKKLDILSIEPNKILTNPSGALEGKPNIGITYKEGMKPPHKVAKGFPTVNTHQLLSQIAEILKEYLQPIDAQRQSYKTNNPSNQFVNLKKPEHNFAQPLLRKKEETEANFQLRLGEFYKTLSSTQATLRRAIRSSTGEHLTLWLFYIYEANLAERLKAIKYCLGVPELSPGTYSFPEGLTVTIHIQEVAALAERLNLPFASKPNNTEREKAIKKRTDEIAAIVQPMQSVFLGKVGVWFELYEKNDGKFVTISPDNEGEPKKYFAPWGDPKRAIRLGFAEMGMVTQFITPNQQESYHQKAICSFIDLLRSLGGRMAPSYIKLPNVDKDTPINEVGLWLVNRTSQTSADGNPQLIPVIAKMSSLTAEIHAIFPGIESWLPYDEALTRINKDGFCCTNDEKGKAKIRNFIEQTLNRKELRGKPTLLYCKAQNIRNQWSWLQDKQISPNNGLLFADRENPVFEHFPNLRVLRLRSGDETPEWVGMDGEKVSGFITGLFKNPDSERVFLSIGEKSSIMRNISKNLSRIKKPEEFWVHPSIVEIVIGYSQEGDNLVNLAAIAHKSRHGVLQYEGYLEVPRVLHYAKQMADYVLMLDDEESDADD